MKNNIIQTKTNNTIGKYSLIILLILLGLLTCLYLITRAFPLLIVTEENYGAYFFPRANWLFPHIILGITATVIGPFQFIPQIRNKYLNLHRKLGRVYIIATVLGGISGMYLAITSGVNLTYAVGLFMLSIAWSTSSIMAFISIKNKKVALHKDWMIRSYILTFSFVLFRLVVDLLQSLNIASRIDAFVLMSWAAWVIPLFIAEVFIQGSKINNNINA